MRATLSLNRSVLRGGIALCRCGQPIEERRAVLARLTHAESARHYAERAIPGPRAFGVLTSLYARPRGRAEQAPSLALPIRPSADLVRGRHVERVAGAAGRLAAAGALDLARLLAPFGIRQRTIWPP